MQSVLKVRKRVTLMAVTVSVVFGVSWGTSSAVYVMRYFSSYNFRNAIIITNTMVYFNSAVNPIVYALVNQRFREKIEEMICCRWSSTNKIHSQTMESVITHHSAEPCYKELNIALQLEEQPR